MYPNKECSNNFDLEEESTLHFVARRRGPKCVRFILSTGEEDVHALTTNKNTALHCALVQSPSWVRLTRSAGEIEEIVDMLLEAEIDVNARNNNSETALYLACKLGLEQVAKKLLAKGAEVDVTESEYGYTPLHWACTRMSAEFVLELLNRGARINALNLEGISPLFAACENSKVEVVKLLLEWNARTDHLMEQGESPLFRAVVLKNVQIIELLGKAGADPYFHDGLAALEALDQAWYLEEFESFMALVKHAGLDVNYAFPDENNSTILHLACSRQDTSNINALLELGASITRRNDKNQRPMDLLDLNLKEIQSMKRLFLDRYTSLYDLFVDINKMTRYAESAELKEVMDVVVFPKFGGLLRAQLDRAKIRAGLLRVAKSWMQKLTKLPEYPIVIILEHLSEEELNNFISSNQCENANNLFNFPNQ